MSNRPKKSFRAWIVSGPSGSGKTSLCEALLKNPFWGKRLLKTVSYTTRSLRPGERQGRDYRHISKERFLILKKQGALLESEKIFGAYYGTPKKAVAEAKRLGRDLLLCIDVKGARTLRRFFKKEATSIFILAPKEKVLRERLKKRSTENRDQIHRRLRRVKSEMGHMKEYDYVVVNDDFNEALGKIKSILTAKTCEEAYVVRSIREAY
jgi:guanylate kinase